LQFRQTILLQMIIFTRDGCTVPCSSVVYRFKIDHDNLRMKCSALNVDFNGVRYEITS